MNRISCDICLDLIPLVKDGVASKDSREAVVEHIAQCERCHTLFDGEVEEKPKMNEQRVFAKLRKQLFMMAMAMIALGVFVGVGLTESAGMFYNVLIMPTIGAIGYFALRKKAYYLPAMIFVIVYGWHFIKYATEGIFDKTEWVSAIIAPTLWAMIYGGLCALGVLIAFLLYIAFKKEKK